MQFQETCPIGAEEQCFSWPVCSLTAYPDGLRCLDNPKAGGRGLFPARLPSRALSKLWRKQKGTRAYFKIFAKIFFTHVNVYACQDAEKKKSLETSHPAVPWMWGAGKTRLPSSRSTAFSTPVSAESSTAPGSTNAQLYAKRYKTDENIKVFLI